MTILDEIVETKRREVAEARTRVPLDALSAKAAVCAPARDFYAAVAGPPAGDIRLIAEIKQASPSAGLIVADFDPLRIARIYADHGAAALSVLTDEPYFGGRLEYIEQVKDVVPLPVLRKEFLIDEYQIHESRAAGADAVLLIAEILEPDQMNALAMLAGQLGMAVLIEVHSEDRLMDVVHALGTPAPGRYLLGINNRDLTVQRTDLATMNRLADHLPPDTAFVAESGIASREDVLRAKSAGACAVLVGESLLRAPNLGAKVDELLGK